MTSGNLWEIPGKVTEVVKQRNGVGELTFEMIFSNIIISRKQRHELSMKQLSIPELPVVA